MREELTGAGARLGALSAAQRARPGPNGRSAEVNALALTPRYAEQLAHLGAAEVRGQ